VFADVEIEARKRAFLSEPAAAHAASVVARLDLCRDTSKACARVRSCPNRLARATAAPHCVHECIPSALGVPAESTGLCADPAGAFSIVGRHASRRRPFALFPYPRLECFSSSGPRLLPESEPVLRRLPTCPIKTGIPPGRGNPPKLKASGVQAVWCASRSGYGRPKHWARIRLLCYAGTRQQHEAGVVVVLQLCAHGQVAPVGRDGNFILNKGTGYLRVEVCGVQRHDEINCFVNKSSCLT
jgi:hypothetical protein